MEKSGQGTFFWTPTLMDKVGKAFFLDTNLNGKNGQGLGFGP